MKSNFSTPAVVSWLCLWLTAGPCLAWGPEGHVVVGKIAEQHLTPKTRAALAGILNNRPLSDSRIVNWADYIKSSANYDRKYRNHRTWHYVDIHLDLPKADYKPVREFKGKPADNVIARIDHFKRVMTDPSVNETDRKEALFFVAHFIGDFHQPLHCCDRNDDKGGNLQKIASYDGIPEERLNLHWVWDGKLVQENLGAVTPEDFAVRINAEITDADRAAWQKGGTQDWAWDTHEVAVSTVYKFADSGQSLPSYDESPVSLTQENYIRANAPVVRKQLQKAGIRLAKVLNDAFDPQP